MPDLVKARRSALEVLGLPIVGPAATVAVAGELARFIYRGESAVIGAVFGPVLPNSACRAEQTGDRAALWLGPDEWLLLANPAESSRIYLEIKKLCDEHSASIVDVGHRNFGLILDGPKAGRLLSAGCPLDLDPAEFLVGMCTRTLLAQAEIVLWRTAENRFHIEAGRSFAPYVVGFLREALRNEC